MTRTIDKIDSECAQAVLELGRRTYHLHLWQQECDALKAKIFALNAEALALKQAEVDADAAAEATDEAVDSAADLAVMDASSEGAANE